MRDRTQIVIVGAGPYGLSCAAHLKAESARVRIFGNPMGTWREQMPKKMYLKSDGFASSLSDPLSTFTLKDYCEQNGIAYDDTRIPVPIETFIGYGVAFQQRFVPELEEKQVVGIERNRAERDGGFLVTLDDGEVVATERVVLAVGITHFAHLPVELEKLPEDLVSHSSAHHDLESFRGREVTVLGAGASALDTAALLHEVGAQVTLVARGSQAHFHTAPGNAPRPLWQRIRHPRTGIGPGLRSYFYTGAPGIFRLLPRSVRHKIVRTHLRPAAGWPMKERVLGKVPLMLGYSLEQAKPQGDRIALHLRAKDGTSTVHTTGHVLAATGYKPRLDRLTMLSQEIRNCIQTEGYTPVLGSDFQSSIPGLYFVGVAAANTFGPMLRFAFGSEFTARRLAQRMAAELEQQESKSQVDKVKLQYTTPAR